MAHYTDTCFLCGFLSCPPHRFPVDIPGWQKVEHDAETVVKYKQYYYPEFVDFWFGGGSEGPVASYSFDCCEVLAVESECTVRMAGINLNIMPFGMVLYSVRIELEGDNLNAFTLMLSRLRCTIGPVPAGDDSVSEVSRRFSDMALPRLRAAVNALGCANNAPLLESGNKFKIFQIVQCESGDEAACSDITLFEMATLSPVGGYTPDSPEGISQSYVADMLKRHKICFYNNWHALVLFDGVTIMARDVKPWIVQNWVEDYFGMIYMHSLFSKFFLFRLNTCFRSGTYSGTRIEKDLNEFERNYCFHRISYNFMPGEVDKAIDDALELRAEKVLLRSYIRSCNEQQAKEADRRFGSFLTLLTVLTVFSTLWDFSSMTNAMWSFSSVFGADNTGFRVIVSAALLFILAAYALIMLPRRRRR